MLYLAESRIGNYGASRSRIYRTALILFPAYINLIHYICFPDVAFCGESKALSADQKTFRPISRPQEILLALPLSFFRYDLSLPRVSHVASAKSCSPA
jgi:hypothetical protein